MEKFIQKKKMSKKKKRELDAKKRVLWETSPVTRRVESKKLYSRKRRPLDHIDDGLAGVLLLHKVQCA